MQWARELSEEEEEKIMYTYCIKSGVPIQVSETLSRFKVKVESVHPVFYLETKRLLTLSVMNLSDEEVQLVFVALLDRTGLVEFRSPANPTVETCRMHIRKLAWIVHAITERMDKEKLADDFIQLRVNSDCSTIPNLTAILIKWEDALNKNNLCQAIRNKEENTSKLESLLWDSRSNLSSAKSGLNRSIINWAEKYLDAHKDYDITCITLIDNIRKNVEKRPSKVYASLPVRLKSKMLFEKMRRIINQSIDESEEVINRKYALIRYIDLLISYHEKQLALDFNARTKNVVKHIGDYSYTVAELDIKFNKMDTPEPVRTDFTSDYEYIKALATYNRMKYLQ